MTKKIIYPNDIGGIAIITPFLNCGLTVEEIAKKDVPEGLPYLIIETTDLPTDVEFRDAWECNFDEPDGYGIGHTAWFAERS